MPTPADGYETQDRKREAPGGDGGWQVAGLGNPHGVQQEAEQLPLLL